MKHNRYAAIYLIANFFALNAATSTSGATALDWLDEIANGADTNWTTVPARASCAVVETPEGTLVGCKSLPTPDFFASRPDIYNHSRELARVLQKITKSDCRVKNEMDEDCNITLSYLPYNTDPKDGYRSVVYRDITAPSKKTVEAPIVPNYYVAEATSKKSGSFFDIYDTTKGFVLSISDSQMMVYPRPFSCTSFTPHPNRMFMHLPREQQAKLRRAYKKDPTPNKAPLAEPVQVVSSTLDIFAQETADIIKIFSQREALYQKNRLESLIPRMTKEIAEGSMALPLKAKIPMNLFSIWFTKKSPDSGVAPEPDKSLIDFALVSRRNNPKSDGWTQYFVTNDKSCIPNTIKYLSEAKEKYGLEIVVKELSEFDTSKWRLRDEIFGAIDARQMGRASDMARVEIINEIGGGYLDIDLETFQSLTPYFYLYDSLWGEEDWSYFACNAFMAAKPGHPIIEEYLRLLKRNFSEKDQPAYIRNERDKQWKTIMQTGPGVESMAIFNGADQAGNVDMVFPIQAFFPVVRHLAGTYTPRHTCHLLESATMHYYLGTWTAGSKYSSNA